MFGGRGNFLAALRALDEKTFAANFATGAFGFFARPETFKGSAVGARHAKRIFARVDRRLVGIFQQARRLVVERGTQLVSQKVREGLTNLIYTVVREVAVALEHFGRGFYFGKKIFQRLDFTRVVVFEAAVVVVENLRLRQIEQGFNRLPLRNRRGKFFGGVTENFAQIVGGAVVIKTGLRFNLLDVKRQLVQVVNVR